MKAEDVTTTGDKLVLSGQQLIAFWQFHVGLLLQVSIQIGHIHIYLMELPIVLSYIVKKQTDCGQSNCGGKGFKVIYAMLL